MAKVAYAKSMRKQIAIALGFSVAWILIGFVWQPLNTSFKQVAFLFITLFLGVIAIVAVRKVSTEAKCPNCNADLFGIIQGAKYHRVAVRYCPSCGKEVEI